MSVIVLFTEERFSSGCSVIEGRGLFFGETGTGAAEIRAGGGALTEMGTGWGGGAATATGAGAGMMAGSAGGATTTGGGAILGSETTTAG